MLSLSVLHSSVMQYGQYFEKMWLADVKGFSEKVDSWWDGIGRCSNYGEKKKLDHDHSRDPGAITL